MNKNQKKALIIALSICGAGVLISLCVLASVNFDLSRLSARHNVGVSKDDSETIKAEHIEKDIDESGQNISLNLSSADVVIKPSDDEKIHISYDNTEETYFELESTGKKINLTQKQKSYITFGVVFFSDNKLTVEVYIPADHEGNLDINGASSDISVSDMKFEGKFDINSVSGDIVLQNCEADTISTGNTSGEINISAVKTTSIEASTISGDININEITEKTPISLETTSGKVYAENVSAQDIKAESISGGIELVKVTGNTANLSSTSGDVHLDLADFQEIVYNSVSGSIKGTVCGSSDDYTVYTDSISGSNSLSSHRGRGDRTLDLSSTSGSFNISFEK